MSNWREKQEKTHVVWGKAEYHQLKGSTAEEHGGGKTHAEDTHKPNSVPRSYLLADSSIRKDPIQYYRNHSGFSVEDRPAGGDPEL